MGNMIERKINNEKIDDIIHICSNGDPDAERYLYDICFVSRVMDDLIDKDYDVNSKDVCKAFFNALGGLMLNPFFVRNMFVLIGIHIASYNSWMDANKWEKSDNDLKKHYAHVMKDFINEVCGIVAFLTGGYNHMRMVSEKTKDLFIEEV